MYMAISDQEIASYSLHLTQLFYLCPDCIGDAQSVGHFFLNPAGHLGFIAVTFLIVFPLMQVMVVFFVAAALSAIALSMIAFLSGGQVGVIGKKAENLPQYKIEVKE